MGFANFVDGSAGEAATQVCKVLVVDDEPIILHLIKTALHAPGLYVITCDGGHEALLILEEYKAGIALVLSDVRMPGMSGPQLIRKVIEKSPTTAVAFMSGHTGQEILDPEVPLLRKPFELSALRVLVDRLLARQRSLIDKLQTQIRRNNDLVTDQRRIVMEVQAIALTAMEKTSKQGS